MKKIYVLEVKDLPTELWLDKDEAHRMASAYDYPDSVIVAYTPVVEEVN